MEAEAANTPDRPLSVVPPERQDVVVSAFADAVAEVLGIEV